MLKQTFHTYDGFIFPNGAPSVQTVALSLCRESRYCGNGRWWWNVGLHSFVVADMLPDHLKFHGLVHDQPECITGDIPHDLKTKKQRTLERALLNRFYAAHDVKPPTKEEHELVKLADRRAVNAEVWAGAGTECLKQLYPDAPDDRAIVVRYLNAYSYEACLDVGGIAVQEFVRRFYEYRELLR